MAESEKLWQETWHGRHWKDHFKNDLRSDQDHLLKIDLRSDQDHVFLKMILDQDQYQYHRYFLLKKYPFFKGSLFETFLTN
jgi:hypothetical protein